MKPGDKVYYINSGNTDISKFNLDFGIVKEVRDDIAFVVFHCSHDWSEYWKYTGARCKLSDLFPGWSAVVFTKSQLVPGHITERHFTYNGRTAMRHNMSGPSYTEYDEDGEVVRVSYYIDDMPFTEEQWEVEWLKHQAKLIGLDGIAGDKNW